MSILVTGGAGYIGSHIVAALMRLGYDVTIYDNFSNSYEDAVDGIYSITGKRPATCIGDVREKKDIERAIRTYKASHIIHCAALKSVEESQSAPLDYYETNCSGTINVVQAAIKNEVRHLVYSSSATVYRSKSKGKIVEYDETHPISVYAKSKLIAECVINDARATHGIHAAILRYFNPAGAHPSAKIGESPKRPSRNLFPILADLASGRVPNLAIYGESYDTRDGTCERDYVHVMDVAEAHIAALRYNGTLNIGTGRGYTVREVVKAYARASGTDLCTTTCPPRQGDVARSVADCEKAACCIGWRAKRGIDDMCASAWAYAKNQRKETTDGHRPRFGRLLEGAAAARADAAA